MWLNAGDVQCLHGNIFVFDLEWIGDISDNPQKCKIWDIGCVHVVSGATFSRCVLPNLTGDNLSEDHGGVDCVPPVTRAMIQAEDHGTLRTVVQQWCEWLQNTCQSDDKCILVAHNCFRADALVLMHELYRCGASVFMHNVFMMDSLLHMRYVLRDENTPSFSLHNLCNFMDSPAPREPHRAISDCIALSSLLSKCRTIHNCEYISGIAMPFGQVSLTVVSGIGVSCAMRFSNALSINDLWELESFLYAKHGSASLEACTNLLVEIMPDMSTQRCQYTAENIIAALQDISI